MINIDFTKYDLTDPNITASYIMKEENISRNGLYFQFKKFGIKLGHRGMSDKAKLASFGKKSKKRLNNPFLFNINRLFKQWRSGAESRNIYFDISVEDILGLWNKQNGLCALSGIELKNNEDIFNASLDRIDSDKEYTIDNIQLVLKEVNYMKQSLSQEYFINLCKKISNNNV